MVCPISQPHDVSLSPGAKPNFAVAGVSSATTGLRSYSPELGRWVSRDPIGERGGENLWVWLLNSPLNFLDAIGNYAGPAPGPEPPSEAPLPDPGPPEFTSECIQLALDIARLMNDIRMNKAKFDPITDCEKCPSKWTKDGSTKPGSHRRKIERLQEALKDRLRNY